ncbi:cytochrome P450 [Lactarius hatsudake]|nr:cytochrome P450 [Lactarius hatsudake]
MVGGTLLRTVTTFLVGIVFLVSLFVCCGPSQLSVLLPNSLSYLSLLRFNFDGVRMLKEGHEKTKPGLFKIPTLRTWMVFATSPALIEDVRKAPNDVLSHRRRIEKSYQRSHQFLQTDYTLDFLNKQDYFHIHVMLSKLTRITSTTFEDIYEELVLALDDNIPTGKGRNRDYQALNLNFATNVIKFATTIKFFPDFLMIKPLVARTISNLPSQVRQEMEFIGPMYEERLARMGDDDSPSQNDRVNFAGIHATSSYCTAFLPTPDMSYVGPLRRGVEAVVAEYGWTTDGMDKLHKIDSFLRETQRWGLSVWHCVRPFTFSNGITIPAGTFVAAPLSAIHADEEIYTNPDESDGFRFERLRESSEDLAASRYQTGVTSPAHLSFGHGRHACPGRFFAATELKVMLARIVTTYDLKLEDGKEIPRDLCLASLRIQRNVKMGSKQWKEVARDPTSACRFRSQILVSATGRTRTVASPHFCQDTYPSSVAWQTAQHWSKHSFYH